MGRARHVNGSARDVIRTLALCTIAAVLVYALVHGW